MRSLLLDNPHAHFLDPLQFPPIEYICNQLKQCCALFRGKSLYVFLFTDYDKPKEIAGYFKRELSNEKVSFGWRSSSKGYQGRTLMDFFSMMEFDCIIRSASSYSTMAAKISPCWLEIGPKNFAFVDGKPRITEVEFRYRPDKMGDPIKNLKKVSYEKHFVEVKAQ